MCVFVCLPRLFAPSGGAAATLQHGNAGSSFCSQALPLLLQLWRSMPSWRLKRTTSTSTASGTCWLLVAWASCCHPVPSLTPRWHQWGASVDADTSSALMNTRRWASSTRPLSPSTASAPADDAFGIKKKKGKQSQRTHHTVNKIWKDTYKHFCCFYLPFFFVHIGKFSSDVLHWC